jgi:hypothetical protein
MYIVHVFETGVKCTAELGCCRLVATTAVTGLPVEFFFLFLQT